MKKFTKTITTLIATTFLLLTFIPVINLSVSALSLSPILIDNYDNIFDCHEGMIAVQKNNKYGFINKNGEVIVPLIYDNVENFNEGVAEVVKDNKRGFIDKTGKIIIPIQYDVRFTRNMYSWAENCIEGMIAVSIDDKWGYFDNTGKAILPLEYDAIRPFSEGLAAIGIKNENVKFNGDITHEYLSSYIKWGYIDKTGKIVIPIQYGNTSITESGDFASDFENGYVQVYDIKSKKTKYIDKTGKELSFEFDSYMGQNLYSKKTNNDKFIIIDNTGKQIIKGEFQDVALFENGYIRVGELDKNNNWKFGIIDKTGKTIIPLEYDHIYSSTEKENYFTVTKGEKFGVIDDTKKIIVPIEYDPMEMSIKYIDNIFIVTSSGNDIAFYNLNGKINFDYKEVKYLGNSLFIVSNDGRKTEGIIDINGKVILPLDSHRVSRQISEGLIMISKELTPDNNSINERISFIDVNGNIIIPAIYTSAREFKNDISIVKQADVDNNDRYSNEKTYILINPLHNENNTQQDTSIKAVPTPSKVYINGELKEFEAYNINGNNYFKLRDIAYALKDTSKQFEVIWDNDNSTINLFSYNPYTPIGGEMIKSENSPKNITSNSSIIYKDSEPITFQAYNINGNNYFKLRDIAESFNFSIFYDEISKNIYIDTFIDYIE